MSLTLNDEQIKQLRLLLENNQPILAIKTYRELTGADLFAAKEFIQSIQTTPTYLDDSYQEHQQQDHVMASFTIGLPVETLKWHAVKKAPKNIQELINPENELPTGVAFVPALKVTHFDVLFQKFIVILLGCMSAGLIYIFINASNPPAWWVQAVVIGVAIFFAMMSMWILKKKTKLYSSCQSLVSQGTYRSGLLLMKDALLINYNEHIYLAPKRQIDRFTAIFRGRSQGRSLEMVLLGKGGEKVVMNLDFLKLNNVKMQRELTTWLRQSNQ